MRKILMLTVVAAFIAATAVPVFAKDYGKAKLTAKKVVIQLNFKGGKKLVIKSKAKRIPVGTYRPESYTLMKKGKGGVYKLTSVTARGATAWSLTVEKGETTEIDVGPPLKVTPIRYRSRRTKTGQLITPIGFVIQGKNGEYYEHGVRIGSRRVPAPAFQIESENGKVLASGKFEYG